MSCHVMLPVSIRACVGFQGSETWWTWKLIEKVCHAICRYVPH